MNGLQAGFARVDITPKVASVPLAGFGAVQHRISTRVIDPLYANVTALANGGEACLYLSLDIVGVVKEDLELYREAIFGATGFRKDRIFLTATHTHAGPARSPEIPAAAQYMNVELRDYLVDAAQRALADLKPAKLSYGTVEVGKPGCRFNFDRHYYAVPIEKKDNWTDEDLLDGVGDVRAGYMKGDTYVAVKHVEEADHRMHLLRFTREAADDIILVNFAAHSTFTGGTTRPEISSDYPGALVKRMEELLPGTRCAFLQGCCGNLVPKTEIAEEGIWGLTYPTRNAIGGKDKPVKVIGPRPWIALHYAYAAALAGYAYQALLYGMKDSGTDTLQFLQYNFRAKNNHEKDHLAEKAKQALELFEKNGHSPESHAYCAKFGLGSIYSCMALLLKAERPEYGEMELNAIRIGDCAIVTTPMENFSSLGEHVKAASPFAMTVVNDYCCGFDAYLPNKNAHPDCYECAIARFAPGTSEKLETELGRMLEELYKA